ncbi:MAG: hypothetical protein K2N90_03500 [Lachnospiraceae bacterium]|nr:hypothetical protein [Lachnospiraceae bacterium]
MDRKREFTMNIGLPSIMLIFVVLCLISFGVLSLVSANADRKLSQKVLDRSAAYYNACNLAEEKLCEMDTALKKAYQENPDRTAYVSAISALPTEFTFKISEIQYLEMTLSYLYPESADDPFYQLRSWRVVTRDDLDYDDGLHLIEIEDIE